MVSDGDITHYILVMRSIGEETRPDFIKKNPNVDKQEAGCQQGSCIIYNVS